MVAADGQKIKLPEGDYNKVFILAAATEDTRGDVKAGSRYPGLISRTGRVMSVSIMGECFTLII